MSSDLLSRLRPWNFFSQGTAWVGVFALVARSVRVETRRRAAFGPAASAYASAGAHKLLAWRSFSE
jgi:hypothetical protein